MKLPELKRQNRRLLFVMLLGLILALVLMSLPLYHFTASVYTKKSGNTVVGDEKYQTVRAEVEALAEDYRAQGFDVEINESVLERVNSKGETTSLCLSPKRAARGPCVPSDARLRGPLRPLRGPGLYRRGGRDAPLPLPPGRLPAHSGGGPGIARAARGAGLRDDE